MLLFPKLVVIRSSMTPFMPSFVRFPMMMRILTPHPNRDRLR